MEYFDSNALKVAYTEMLWEMGMCDTLYFVLEWQDMN